MRLIIGIVIIAFASTSCTTFAPRSAPPSTQSWQARESRLNQLQHWQIQGKIAAQTTQNAGSASIDWSQNNQHYTISLMGPLGSNGMKLSGQPGHVLLETADGKQFTASSPEQLLAKQWGWNLPVSYLQYWIRGLPVPQIAAATHFDNYNRLSALGQAGWQIEYLGYTNQNGIELPQRINITSAALKTKIVIYAWNINVSH